MSRVTRFIAPVVAAAICSLTQFACGEIVMTITDDGTDLTMQAVGDYDFSGLVSISDALGKEAVIGPALNGGTFGWETGGPSIAYSVAFSGGLTGSRAAINPSAMRNSIPFYFNIGNGTIHFASGASAAPPSGTVNETAVFSGMTLATLGMVAGETIEVTFETGDGGLDQVVVATITTASVPEPSSMILFGMAGLVAWRRRR